MCINRRTDKADVKHTHGGILLSHMKEWKNAIRSNVDVYTETDTHTGANVIFIKYLSRQGLRCLGWESFPKSPGEVEGNCDWEISRSY